MAITTIKLDATKILLWVCTALITIASAFGTYFINDIRTDLKNVSVAIKELKNDDLKTIVADIHGIELTLNKTTYNEQSLLDKIKILKKDFRKLEERLP